MKKYISKAAVLIKVLFLLSLCIISVRSNGKAKLKPVTGHFTSAKKSSRLILQIPQMNSTETGCDDGCITEIKFPDPKIPVIAIKDCIGGELTNLGDLNGDGLDEIGFLPGWFAGCWHNYRVFTFKHKQWQLAVPPFQTHCNEFEAEGVKPIVTDVAKPGNVIITYSAFIGNKIVFKKKSEPIR